ncbi:hypothetical protein T4E_1279 [Trichinella pseudospiralis]|uniref:Uncharacterized protein n=1 Tax=Trichinella pseudospiralis TaxID=6337 RepID=A0A0V0XVX3_TRIPS|nr:hypothetical protein T4E_1279 [Trichinella pseudospiralis]
MRIGGFALVSKHYKIVTDQYFRSLSHHQRTPFSQMQDPSHAWHSPRALILEKKIKTDSEHEACL